MPARHPFEEKLSAAWPPPVWQDTSVVLAVSGGADSVALALAMAAIRQRGAGRLTIAHFNHGLRGSAADADQQFVCTLAAQLGLPIHLGSGNLASFDRAAGEGWEAVARAARYEFLQETAERAGARYVVTAHTADDQAETILHRIVRGTGLAGLSGMERARPLGQAVSLLRPMLGLRRDEGIAYLESLGQPFCEDESNGDPRYTRNRLRHDLLPRLAEQYNPRVREALVRLAGLAGEAQQVIDRLVDELLARALRRSTAECVELEAHVLDGQSPYLLRELFIALWKRQSWPLQAMGYAQWDELARLIHDPGGDGKRIFPGAVVVERLGGNLRLGCRSQP